MFKVIEAQSVVHNLKDEHKGELFIVAKDKERLAIIGTVSSKELILPKGFYVDQLGRISNKDYDVPSSCQRFLRVPYEHVTRKELEKFINQNPRPTFLDRVLNKNKIFVYQ